MKIAIMNCMNTSRSCVAAACFRAYAAGTNAFAAYSEDDRAQLAGFFPCGGCDMVIESDEGFAKKLDKLKTEGVQHVHISKCASGCKRVQDFVKAYEGKGIEVVLGTH